MLTNTNPAPPTISFDIRQQTVAASGGPDSAGSAPAIKLRTTDQVINAARHAMSRW